MSVEHTARLQLKLPIARAAHAPERERVLEVWHDWIKHRRVEDDTLVDVVDYGHVHEGPGVALVGHRSDYYFDTFDGVAGLTHYLKRSAAATLAARLDEGYRALDRAAGWLAADARLGGLAFDTERLIVRAQDRLHAPNTDAAFGAFAEAALGCAARCVPGRAATAERFGSARQPLGAMIRFA